jgi:hypothetical protein
MIWDFGNMTYFVMNDQSTLPIYMPFGSGNTTGLGATLLDILEKGGKKHDFCVNHNIKEDAFSTPTQI